MRRHIEYYSSSPNSFGINLKAPEGDTSGPLFYGQKGQLFLHQLTKRFIDKISSARDDKRLTDKGKAEQITQAANDAMKELRVNYRRFLDPLVHKYQTSDTSKVPALKPTDTLEAVKRAELRQYLLGLDGERRREIFDAALVDDDSEILGAYFERSNLYQLLGSEILDAAKRQYLQRHAPDFLVAGTSGAVLTYNIQKTAEDLALFAEAPDDCQAIFAELPRFDWKFESNDDFSMIQHNRLTSILPDATQKPMSHGQRLEAMKLGGKKMNPQDKVLNTKT